MNEDRITVKNALLKGDLFTKLSAVLMGAGIAGHRQIIKGAVVTEAQGKVWNEAKQIYEYSTGDNSQQILLAGVVTCFVIAGFIALWILQLQHSYKLQKMIEKGETVPSLGKDVKNLFDGYADGTSLHRYFNFQYRTAGLHDHDGVHDVFQGR